MITLHYLGEMTAREIGNLLGVSVHTITSRLQRARKRLQADEELMVQEVFSGVQVPASLSQNVMRRVADMNPVPPPATKPLFPWMAFGAATILVLLMLGVSQQYLARFQKPYSFEAQSEPTIEIVDVPIVLDIDAKPAVRNQDGQAALPTENRGIGLQTSENVWHPIHKQGPSDLPFLHGRRRVVPQGSHVSNLFVTSQKTLYATTPTGIYSLAPEESQWTLINTGVPTSNFSMPMAEHGDALYIVSRDEVFASGKEGESWKALGPRPEGDAVGLIVTTVPQNIDSQAGIALYIALRDKGVFRSTGAGEQWTHLEHGLTQQKGLCLRCNWKHCICGHKPRALSAQHRYLEQLPVDPSSAVHALVVSENNLYVGVGADLFALKPLESNTKRVEQIVPGDNASASRIFHSPDLGTSWREITPKDGYHFVGGPTGIKLLVTSKILLAQGMNRFLSRDGGKTWTDLGFDRNSFVLNSLPLIGINESTFYRAGGLWDSTHNGWRHLVVLIYGRDRRHKHTRFDYLQ